MNKQFCLPQDFKVSSYKTDWFYADLFREAITSDELDSDDDFKHIIPILAESNNENQLEKKIVDLGKCNVTFATEKTNIVLNIEDGRVVDLRTDQLLFSNFKVVEGVVRWSWTPVQETTSKPKREKLTSVANNLHEEKKEELPTPSQGTERSYVQSSIDLSHAREILGAKTIVSSQFRDARYLKADKFAFEIKGKSKGQPEFTELRDELVKHYNENQFLLIINTPSLKDYFSEYLTSNSDLPALLKSKNAVREMSTEQTKLLWVKWMKNFTQFCNAVDYPILGLDKKDRKFRDLNLEENTKGKGINQLFTDLVSPEKSGIPCSAATQRILDLERGDILSLVIKAAGKLGLTSTGSESLYLFKMMTAICTLLKQLIPILYVKGRSNRSWVKFSKEAVKSFTKGVQTTGLFVLKLESENFEEKKFSRIAREWKPIEQRESTVTQEQRFERKQKREEKLKVKYEDKYINPQDRPKSEFKDNTDWNNSVTFEIYEQEDNDKEDNPIEIAETSFPVVSGYLKGGQITNQGTGHKELAQMFVNLTEFGAAWAKAKKEEAKLKLTLTGSNVSPAYYRLQKRIKLANGVVNQVVTQVMNAIATKTVKNINELGEFIMDLDEKVKF